MKSSIKIHFSLGKINKTNEWIYTKQTITLVDFSVGQSITNTFALIPPELLIFQVNNF